MLISRRRRLTTFVAEMSSYTIGHLLPILRERRFAPIVRTAALRCLIHLAPLRITKGAPFPQRRRYVRQFYRV